MVISILKILNHKVPLWVALILGVSLAYYVTRPEPTPITQIEYRNYWKPPIVRRTLPPSKLIQYQPVPKGELRVDTIRVPIRLTDYQLWSPSTVTRTKNSIVVRSFDTGTLSYRDYSFSVPQSKYGANLSVSAMVNAFTYEPQFEVEALLRYNKLGAFGRVGTFSQDPYALVGVRYIFR